LKRRVFVLLILIAPLLIFIPHLDDFAYPSGAEYSDVTISHYPNALYIHQSLTKSFELPFWSRTILSGYPFIAHPLSGIWYPPGWLPILIPSALSFNISVLFHLLWGGIGMYAFLRRTGNNVIPAMTGALMFELLPKLLAHFASGHITLIYAFAWTPWLLYFEIDAFNQGKFSLYSAVVIGIIFLADVRWAAYSILLWVVFSLYLNGRKIMTSGTIQNTLKSLFKWGCRCFLSVIIACLIAAPLLLPLMEFIQLSTRGRMTLTDNLVYSLPPQRLLGFLFPDMNGFSEYMVYLGGIGCVSIILILVFSNLRRANWFWLSIFSMATLLSLGENLPAVSWLWNLPGFEYLRVPSRLLFITGLAGTVLVSNFLQGLSDKKILEVIFTFRRRLRLSLFLICSLAISFALIEFISTRKFNAELLAGSISLVIFSILIILTIEKPRYNKTLLIVLPVLCVLDLGITGYSQFDFRSWEAVIGEKSGVVEFLQKQPEPFRTYSPSYSLSQQVAALNGFEIADGVDPMQLTAYVDYMSLATGVPDTRYSVTLPPFGTGNPTTDNRAYVPDAKLLGRLNVLFVLSDFDLKTDGLVFERIEDGVRIYRNRYYQSRAWIENSTSEGDTPIIAYNANHVVVWTEGPGNLVVSDIRYPGWEAKIDGNTVDLADDLFLKVYVPEGLHQIQFDFIPRTAYWGMAIGVSTILALLFVLLRRENRKKII
jgi:hypothetical protein